MIADRVIKIAHPIGDRELLFLSFDVFSFFSSLILRFVSKELFALWKDKTSNIKRHKFEITIKYAKYTEKIFPKYTSPKHIKKSFSNGDKKVLRQDAPGDEESISVHFTGGGVVQEEAENFLIEWHSRRDESEPGNLHKVSYFIVIKRYGWEAYRIRVGQSEASGIVRKLRRDWISDWLCTCSRIYDDWLTHDEIHFETNKIVTWLTHD